MRFRLERHWLSLTTQLTISFCMTGIHHTTDKMWKMQLFKIFNKKFHTISKLPNCPHDRKFDFHMLLLKHTMVQMSTKQNFSILHDPLKPHNYPSDWNKQHDALFGQYMCGIEKTCGINQSGGQYRTREYQNSHSIWWLSWDTKVLF